MHKLKKKRVQPVYVIDEAWRRYLECGRARTSLPGLVKRRRIGTPRSKALGGGPSKHGGGSVSFVTTQERLTPPTVNELYLHLHTVNHDRMTFIDTRSERFYCPKGRVYGLGSLGRKKRRYADPGASTSEMPDMVPRASSMSLRATTKGYGIDWKGKVNVANVLQNRCPYLYLSPSWCVLCKRDNETIDHVFLQCSSITSDLEGDDLRAGVDWKNA
ncbi:hypothetical protein Sjap_020278 [Stephania japonica]|uniref:Reverse transcriptase zinc-binding domain-containing protein n=1 Tax=Stephania japonica TaxID=461633 RepID=A0AAP0F145_9MAGN